MENSPITLKELQGILTEQLSQFSANLRAELVESREPVGSELGESREPVGKKLGRSREKVRSASDMEGIEIIFENGKEHHVKQKNVYLTDSYNQLYQALSKYKKSSDKLKKYERQFWFCIDNDNPDGAEKVIAEMEQHEESARRGRANLPLTVEKSDEFFLSYCSSLVEIIENPRQLHALSQKQAKTVKQLAEQNIPKEFVINLEQKGFATKIDQNTGKVSPYTPELIKRTAQAVLRKPKPNNNLFTWIMQHKKESSIAGSVIFCLIIGLLLFPFIKSKFAASAETVASAATDTIKIAKAELSKFYESFAAVKQGDTTNLYQFELKIFTDKTQFYQYYSPLAIAACKGTRLDPRIPLIQSYRESGGHSELFTKYNNILGIKKGNYKGQTVLMQTTEIVKGHLIDTTDYFRVYPTVYDCFMDYIKKLRNPVYGSVLSESDPLIQCQKLKPYSTDTTYVENLKRELNSFILKTN